MSLREDGLAGTTTDVGANTLTLSSTPKARYHMPSIVDDTTPRPYAIIHDGEPNEAERGYAPYVVSTRQLLRTHASASVTRSTNGNALVSFTSGAKSVYFGLGGGEYNLLEETAVKSQLPPPGTLAGWTLVNDFAPPYGMLPQTASADLVSLTGGGSEASVLTPQATIAAGEATLHSSGGLRLNLSASAGELRSAGTKSIATNIVTMAVAVYYATNPTSASIELYTKRHDTNGYGWRLQLTSAGNLELGIYTAASTSSVVFSTPLVAGAMNVVAISYTRATTATVRWAKNSGGTTTNPNYGEAAVTQAADWAGQTSLLISVGGISSTTVDMTWFGAVEYSHSTLATRAQLEMLLRRMETRYLPGGKVRTSDLNSPELSMLSRLRAGPGRAPTLTSAYLSEHLVTGDPSVTAVGEAYGLEESFTVIGSPQLQADGAIRTVANGATATDAIQKIATTLLTARICLTVDVNVNIAADFTSADLIVIAHSSNGYGVRVNATTINTYTGPNIAQSVAHAIPAGRQRLALYVDFGANPSTIQVISIGLGGAVYSLNGIYAGQAADPTGISVSFYLGNPFAIAGRIGTHDWYGMRLLNSIPSGLTSSQIESLMLAEIDKLARDSDPKLRVPGVPVSAVEIGAALGDDETAFVKGNASAESLTAVRASIHAVRTVNTDSTGFGASGERIIAGPVISTASHTLADGNQDKLHSVVYASGTVTITIPDTLPTGVWPVKREPGASVTTIVGSSNVTYGEGASPATTPAVPIRAGGVVYVTVVSNAGSAPHVEFSGAIDGNTDLLGAGIVNIGKQTSVVSATGASLAAGAVTINLSTEASFFSLTVSASWNAGAPILVSNGPGSGKAQTFALQVTISGSITVSLAGAPWFGTAPTLTTTNGSKILLIGVVIGTTLIGVQARNSL